MKSSRFSLFVMAAVSLALVSAPGSATAATYYWKGSGISGAWDTAANWSDLPDGTGTGAIPGALDNVVFNAVGTNGALGVLLNDNRPVNSFTFNNTGNTSIQSGTGGPRTVTVGTGGITVNAGAGAVEFGDGSGTGVPLRLTGSQTWTNNSSSLLAFRNSVAPASGLTAATPVTLTIDGTGNTLLFHTLNNGADGSVLSLVKNGSGTLDRTSTNTSGYTGGTTLNAGVLQVSTNNQLGAAAGTLKTTAEP